MTLVLRDLRWASDHELSLPAWYPKRQWLDGYTRIWLRRPDADGAVIFLSEETSVASIRSQIESHMASTGLTRVVVVAPAGNSDAWHALIQAFSASVPKLCGKPVKLRDGVALVACVQLVPELRPENVTVLIPHWESLGFLRLCLASFKANFSESRPKILVIDDGSEAATFEKLKTLCAEHSAQWIRVDRPDARKIADVGALLDAGLREVATIFVLMMDADMVVTDTRFVMEPLRRLASGAFVAVGVDTGLAHFYHSSSPWPARPSKFVEVALPDLQTATNNFYRVMFTEDAQAVANGIGFTRAAYARRLRDQVGRLIRTVHVRLRSVVGRGALPAPWMQKLVMWRVFNSRYPAMPPTADNGVAANHWMDANEMGLKFNLPITSYGLMSPRDGITFQNVDAMCVHVALSTRAMSAERREVQDAGREYYDVVQRIMDPESDVATLTAEVIALSKAHGSA